MKKTIVISTAMMLCATMFAGCTNSLKDKQEQSISVYSVSGENEYFSISNGILVLTSAEDIFYGGDLKETQTEFDDITAYTVTFYVISDNEEHVLMSNRMEEETGRGINISGSIGKLTGHFVEQDADITLDNSMYCQLETTNLAGEEKEYLLPLNVTEVTEKAEK